MTDAQILELVKENFRGSGYCIDGIFEEYYGETDVFVKFAREVRKQTIESILTSLKEVPNPDANRTAINRIVLNYD